jgi:hypothetical protein
LPSLALWLDSTPLPPPLSLTSIRESFSLSLSLLSSRCFLFSFFFFLFYLVSILISFTQDPSPHNSLLICFYLNGEMITPSTHFTWKLSRTLIQGRVCLRDTSLCISWKNMFFLQECNTTLFINKYSFNIATFWIYYLQK